ncbi:RNA polymerase sigma factor [Amycolatopsis pigmentata]|uniref:RNA polymerase sigma factor n=1 Tax=Amycolatopsis pigmentata TaxID=450801 RepID=A0ABW5FSW0_9PSEU
MSVTDTHRAVDAVWRIESARIIASLARVVGDVGLAEELAQDALVAALEKWPATGIPANPGAWLTTIAKRRAIDRFRRARLSERARRSLAIDLEGTRPEPEPDEVRDDLLRLMFTACHPVLSTEARVALTLRLLGGLTTGEIARAFLISESAMAQRIVRAKRALTREEARFEMPSGDELAPRLNSVLEVVYLIFNEGYSATAGDDWMRPALCEEALRLGRILAGLAPQEAEAHGLVALMEIQASRARARTDADGEPILLLDQDRRRWDRLLIRRGLAALRRAEELGGLRGPYTVQAAIAACHARAATAGETDWVRIAALYEVLVRLTRSPVVELNRSVAISMAFGPDAGLEIVDELVADGSLENYHLLPSVRGDLLSRLGRAAEARTEFEKAAALTRNARERAVLLRRAETCAREMVCESGA